MSSHNRHKRGGRGRGDVSVTNIVIYPATDASVGHQKRCRDWWCWLRGGLRDLVCIAAVTVPIVLHLRHTSESSRSRGKTCERAERIGLRDRGPEWANEWMNAGCSCKTGNSAHGSVIDGRVHWLPSDVESRVGSACIAETTLSLTYLAMIDEAPYQHFCEAGPSEWEGNRR